MAKQDDKPTEVEPDTMKANAPSVDPDLPETDTEDLGGEEDDDQTDPLEVVIPVAYAKQLADLVRERGHDDLADAFLAVEAGEAITIRVEAV